MVTFVKRKAMRYLDPKNDLTFKKIFGENPHLLQSFLNSLLPIENPIASLEYLAAELVPEIPVFKNSIVDVRCIDTKGRQFIVEMQMLWTDSFKSRVLFNASKAYIKQIDRGQEYKGLQPVYSLCIINENFEPNIDQYLHHYKIVHSQYTDKVLAGLEFVFVELPKFQAKKYTDKRVSVLWLRFLSEIKDSQELISADFYEVNEIEEAVNLLKESSYTRAQLETYDRYWDSVSTEKTLIIDSYDDGIKEGIKEGIKRGKLASALSLKKLGVAIEIIQEATGLTKEEIDKI